VRVQHKRAWGTNLRASHLRCSLATCKTVLSLGLTCLSMAESNSKDRASLSSDLLQIMNWYMAVCSSVRVSTFLRAPPGVHLQ
jgi:hypothetical protein